MIEGQDGINWERFQKIAQVAEDAGYIGLYRSDHFTNPQGPYKDSLECWISLAWLASHSSRIVFGPLVSPVSFRHPSMLVRQAAAVSDLSGGRLQLGVGAGWQEREQLVPHDAVRSWLQTWGAPEEEDAAAALDELLRLQGEPESKSA